MNDQLKSIANSYDNSIDLGKQGIDSYSNLPSFITENPNYLIFLKMKEDENLSDSGNKDILSYLSPNENMNFIDLGCCLNLMFRGYSEWKSLYYGIDISPKTIDLLKEYTCRHSLHIGALYCCSMHRTPFEDSFFEIGACIGSIEYFEKNFVHSVINEIYRILKTEGKFVLDIPDVGSPEFKITAIIEEFLGRPDKFNMTIVDFEELLKSYFHIERKEKAGPMLQYYVIKK